MYDNVTFPLMEMVYTLQGEGFYSGSPAFFIRLAGCDVGCVWCDVKSSWEATNHPTVDLDKIVEETKLSGAKMAVITGGEPFTYNLNLLTRKLQENKILTNVETAGVNPPSGEWDWICFSPKKFKKPLDIYYTLADELKIVVYHKSDLEWASSHAEKLQNDALLYLQPEWSKREEMTKIIIDFIKNNPHWKLSLQTHKYVNIP